MQIDRVITVLLNPDDMDTIRFETDCSSEDVWCDLDTILDCKLISFITPKQQSVLRGKQVDYIAFRLDN